MDLNELSVASTAVVVVDIQVDFTTDRRGSLSVAGTDRAYLDRVRRVTARLKKAGFPVFATQDCHPPGHLSFASSHPGKEPLEKVTLPDGREQMLWPDHCVEGTEGAGLLLEGGAYDRVIKKGRDPLYDSYSSFMDDGGIQTGLKDLLTAAGIKTVIIYGLASDYCVLFTTVHGLEAGFEVLVIKSLCRGVAPETTEAAWAEMERAGAVIVPDLDPEG